MARANLAVLPLALFLLLSAASAVPQSRSTLLALPHRTISASPRGPRSSPIQWRSNLRLGERGVEGSSCSYTVTIVTSCSSPTYTRDEISLEFGDRYGNEVYVERLDDPSSGTFERCSTDTFRITGQCTYATCFLYLYRYGRDGWVPDSVKVSGAYGTVTFYYRTPLPNDKWYGYDLCHSKGAILQPSTIAAATAAAITAVVAGVSSSESG